MADAFARSKTPTRSSNVSLLDATKELGTIVIFISLPSYFMESYAMDENEETADGSLIELVLHPRRDPIGIISHNFFIRKYIYLNHVNSTIINKMIT